MSVNFNKLLPGLFILPLMSASVYTEVRNEVSGENTSVTTNINNVVNGQQTEVTVDKPGTVKVEINDNEVKIETSPSISPIVTRIVQPEATASLQAGTQNVAGGEVIGTQIVNKTEEIRLNIETWFNNLFSRISELFKLRS